MPIALIVFMCRFINNARGNALEHGPDLKPGPVCRRGVDLDPNLSFLALEKPDHAAFVDKAWAVTDGQDRTVGDRVEQGFQLIIIP